jgi:hypothetical protein
MPIAPALSVGAFVLASAACSGAPAQHDPEVLWSRGVPFAEFLAATEARRDTWHDNHARELPPELLERARAVPGSWRLLVVAVDRCGDSAHTIPYLGRLVAEVDDLDMRIVDPEVGREVMEAHRTPDGRAATPTVLLLDAEGREVGCWVERPAELQSWWIDNPDALDDEARLARKYEWYERDAGATTAREIVEGLEAAAAGTTVCRTGVAG